MTVERKYAKIINEETYEVEIGTGCLPEYYVEIGMELMEVEKAYNNKWYVAGHAPVEPEPSIDEQKEEKRITRDHYISDIEWRVFRYEDQIKLGIPTTDPEEEYVLVLRYMQYLRDYPESSATWYKFDPYPYDVWKRLQNQ